MSERYAHRVGDLLADAEAHAARFEWDDVRALARAALALDAGSTDAQRLLGEADSGAPPEGERRQLTVMFCDVVGSTAFSEQADPEIVREILRSYQTACDEAVRTYEGRIARYVGDGVLAYFGHPVAHEDDARRAVKAGLDLLDALQPVTEEAKSRFGVDLAVRVAVHTGLVVLADMGAPASPDRDAIVGETPNLAARLQDLTRPGSLVISADTWDLVRGYFLVAPLGIVQLKGIARSVAAYEVVEEATATSRIQARADLSPFVGREAELADLTARWEEVGTGAGGEVVFITGEPGIGKTRLTDVLSRRIAADEGVTLATTCSPYHTATALYPVRRLIERAVGIDGADSRGSLPRLWEALDAVGQGDALPLFADLLGIPPEPWCPTPELDGARMREVLLTALYEWVAAAAARAPLLLVIDDLQWSDPTTLELIGRVVADHPPGLLLVLAARADFASPWSSTRRMELGRLGSDELAQMASRLPESRTLTVEHLQELIERSDGIPLYLEELLRGSAVAHAGLDAATQHRTDIPAGLRDLLLARFASPGVDLRLAQIMATIGREVNEDVLSAVAGLPSAELQRQLDGLVAAGLVDREPSTPPSYRFHHHLLAELAYDTQLLGVRQRCHGAIADALAVASSAGLPSDAGQIAHHLERAGRYPEAVEAIVRAGRDAQYRGAHAEATGQLTHGLDLLGRVADDQERLTLELRLRLGRGLSAISTLGFAAPTAVEDHQRCFDLIGDLEMTVEHALLLAGVWSYYMQSGQLEQAHGVSTIQAGVLATEVEMKSLVDSGFGILEFFRGDYQRAGQHLAPMVDEGGIDAPPPPEGWPLPSDNVATCASHLGFTLMAQGRVAEALALIDLGIDRSRIVPFPHGPFSLGYAAAMASAVRLTLGDPDGARAATDIQLEVADRHGFVFWGVIGGMYAAIDAVRRGEVDAAGPANASLAILEALGIIVWMPSFRSILAAAHLANDDVAAAMPLLLAAEDTARRTGAHYWSAETARLLGEARLDDGDANGFDDLRRAATIAGQQGARLFELRARTALCARTGDGDALKELAALVDAFGDEPSFADLETARQLLDDPTAR